MHDWPQDELGSPGPPLPVTPHPEADTPHSWADALASLCASNAKRWGGRATSAETLDRWAKRFRQIERTEARDGGLTMPEIVECIEWALRTEPVGPGGFCWKDQIRSAPPQAKWRRLKRAWERERGQRVNVENYCEFGRRVRR